MRRATASSRRRTEVRISSSTTRASVARASSRSPRARRSSSRRGRVRRAPRRSTSSRSREAIIAEKEEKIELEGEVVEAFRSGMFRIALDNGHETLGYTAGKMRRYRIKVFPGDRVNVELSPYDLDRGRIVYRHR